MLDSNDRVNFGGTVISTNSEAVDSLELHSHIANTVLALFLSSLQKAIILDPDTIGVLRQVTVGGEGSQEGAQFLHEKLTAEPVRSQQSLFAEESLGLEVRSWTIFVAFHFERGAVDERRLPD